MKIKFKEFMPSIHPTAIIEEGATIGRDVHVEAYAIIKANVTLEDRVIIKAHVYLDGHTTIGHDTVIWPGASIGTMTQDLKFKGEITYVKIGSHCQIREYVTINSSTGEGDTVEIGNHCLIMAYCHIAHNCKVGHHVIMSNAATLAGHVLVEDFVIIGGHTPVHQFVRIGAHSMVGGMSRVTQDIPPFTIGAGIPYKLGGLNLLGLKRRGFGPLERNELTQAFKLTYRSGLYLEDALKKIEESFPDSEWVKQWVRFCKTSKRGLIDFSKKNDTDLSPET
jgi:UDP-N-acetylglucosamine acyltransferase